MARISDILYIFAPNAVQSFLNNSYQCVFASLLLQVDAITDLDDFELSWVRIRGRMIM